MKNDKKIFLALTLIIMLLGVTTVVATSNDTTSSTDVVSDTPIASDVSTDTISTQKVVQPTTNEKIVDTRNKETKEDKNIKEDSITIDGVEYTNIVENQEINEDNFNNIVTSENIIINNCVFNYEGENGLINWEGTSLINNSLINSDIVCYGPIYIYNSQLYGMIYCEDTVYVDDDTTFGYNFAMNANSIQTNNTRLKEFLGIHDPIIIDGKEYYDIIENQTINEPVTYTKNVYINNSTYNNDNRYALQFDHYQKISVITNSVLNTYLLTLDGEIWIKNSTLSGGFLNYANVYIDDSVTLTENFYLDNDGNSFTNSEGKIYTNNSLLIQKLSEIGVKYYDMPIDGNTEINDVVISENMTILESGNVTISNSIINAKINNNGNITLFNCSLSNNVMNIAGVSWSTNINGFLVDNKGNLSLVDCYIENNTFNGSDVYAGAILNNKNAALSLNNTKFNNNDVGDVSKASLCLILNLGTISCWDNCEFVNNSLNSYNDLATIGYTPDEFTLNVTNSLFENNTVKVFEASNMSISGSVFNNNKYVFLEGGTPGGGEEPSGMAITAANLVVENCTFDANGIISKHQYAFLGGDGGAIKASNLVVNNSRFTNNIADTMTTWNSRSGSGAAISVTYGEIYNSIFENNTVSNPSTKSIPTIDSESYGLDTEGGLPGSGADIYSTGNIIIKNNTFTNSQASNAASSVYSYVISTSWEQNNITITDNIFTNCKSSSDTIVVEQSGLPTDILITNNTYANNTINDTLTLNIPEKIYTDQPTTITGTYQILNTSFYDADILEKTQFNIYINEELYQTVDTLEFTITPTTTDNLIITVQPSISSTRKSASITPVMLNFTLEPITATIGETTQLTTTITTSEETEVNTGRVYFKVNGKILRDSESGRILYADVTDGTATLDYTVPKTWNEDTTIEAVFAGNDELPQVTSNTVTPTITTPEAQETEFVVEDATATAGSEVTITVTTKNLDSGKVVLKVNGKTVKSTDGKLYAKVAGDSVVFTYTVPKTLKAGDYTIKAVYTSGATRLEADAKLTVG
ncbi:MAG: hypothetical protein BZ136_09505 [Methanosphaera sp. rholeuAM74]|nr:MAG: hypothetical protein BZ136_09505 [Methanosphaera sp. rholeuAM74]